MSIINLKKAGSFLLAGALVLAGCQGERGPAGADGATGPTGPTGPSGVDGQPGSSVGTITGKFVTSTGAAVPGATVKTTPLNLTATTGADGAFTLVDVPIGIYSVQISGTGVAATSFANVVVVAKTATDLGTKTVAYSPIVISFGATPGVAGFAKPVALTSTVTGATGALTYTWSIASGPGGGAFDSTSAQNPTFTTGSFADIQAGGKVRFLRTPERPQLVGITSQQQADAVYTLRLSVSDGKYTQQKDVVVNTAGWVSASKRVGVGEMVIANDVTAASYSWSMTAKPGATTTHPASAAVLEAATTRNPWFIADVEGDYTFANTATGASFTVTAAKFVAPTPDCGTCHDPATTGVKVAGIWAEFNASAHADHLMSFGKGLFAAGIDGEVASYYSAACIKCHTTGYDPTAQNGGFDELGFVFPTKLQAGNFESLPAIQQQYGRITCENCHGPMSRHTNLASAPKAFFNAETCAKCHDALTHHDRYELWNQGGHSSAELALGEGTNASCTKCHSAQGFNQWAATGFNADNNLTFTAASAADVEPQTCQACHDPHTTKLRIDESKPLVLEAFTNNPKAITESYAVQGFGPAMLCMTCHQSRRGLRDDAHPPTAIQAPHQGPQTDLFVGRNFYFIGTDFSSTMSKHAYAIEGACVGCHMAKEGAATDLFLQPATTNHSFRVSDEICANCHGEANPRAALKEQFEAGMANVNAAAGVAVSNLMNGLVTADATTTFTVQAYNPVTDLYTASSNVVIPVPAGADVSLTDIHGQAGFKVVLRAPLSVTWSNATTTSYVAGDVLEFQAGTLKYTNSTVTTPAGVIAATSNLNKGIWNYLMLESDRSEGAHNPALALKVLSLTATNIVK